MSHELKAGSGSGSALTVVSYGGEQGVAARVEELSQLYGWKQIKIKMSVKNVLLQNAFNKPSAVAQTFSGTCCCVNTLFSVQGSLFHLYSTMAYILYDLTSALTANCARNLDRLIFDFLTSRTRQMFSTGFDGFFHSTLGDTRTQVLGSGSLGRENPASLVCSRSPPHVAGDDRYTCPPPHQ